MFFNGTVLNFCDGELLQLVFNEKNLPKFKVYINSFVMLQT